MRLVQSEKMGYMCDFCGEQRSMVYCRSDAASLCLSCDRNVHSANALSKRHSRTLVCERCNAQPASVRCSDERVSLCQNCDWSGHDGTNSTSTSHHKRQTINCYSGCPSSAELSSIWSFCLDLNIDSAGESACEQGMGLMTIDEGTGEKSGVQNVNGDQPETSSAAQDMDRSSVPENSSLAKVLYMIFFILLLNLESNWRLNVSCYCTGYRSLEYARMTSMEISLRMK